MSKGKVEGMDAEQIDGAELVQEPGQGPAQQSLDNLDALDAAEQAAATPEASAEYEEQRQQNEQAAQLGAHMAVGFTTKMLEMRLPYLRISEGDKRELAESLAPVLAKHGGGGEVPAWLVPYLDEIRFGMKLAGVGFGLWLQHQAHVAQQAIERARQESREPRRVVEQQPAMVISAPAVVADPLDPSAQE